MCISGSCLLWYTVIVNMSENSRFDWDCVCAIVLGYLRLLVSFLILGKIKFDGILTFLISHLALLSATILTCLPESHKCLVLQPGLVLPFPLEEAHTNL